MQLRPDVRRVTGAAVSQAAECRGLCRMTDTEPHAWKTGPVDAITYVGLHVYKPALRTQGVTVCVAHAESGHASPTRCLPGPSRAPDEAGNAAEQRGIAGASVTSSLEKT